MPRFQNVPVALFDILGAAKFQHQTMANLINFYKNKCANQRQLIDRLRREVEFLKSENDKLRSHSGGQTYSDGLNEHGKRRRVDEGDGSYRTEDRRYSSPAFGGGHPPSRLTLRPGSSRIEQEHNGSFEGIGASPRSLKEFAFQPPAKEDRRALESIQSSSVSRTEANPRSHQDALSFSKKAIFEPPSHTSAHFNPQGSLVNGGTNTMSHFSTGYGPRVGLQRPTGNPPATPLPGPSTARNVTNHMPLSVHQRIPATPNASQTGNASRRFVPPTPRQHGAAQPLLNRGSLQPPALSTPRFQNSMLPPPQPSFNGGSRFRPGNFG
ncbi:hypothetical protein FRC17_009552 [Serendipita sp. 399]|nr:hypothetical protein FRC17_009552 [Serendipita sp. 399]